MVCVVTSVVGHIFSLGFDSAALSQNGSKQDPADFFDMPVVKQEDATSSKLQVVDHLRALAADCDHLVLWLDCDAEGENIAFETIGVTRRAFEQKMEQEKALLRQDNTSESYEPIRRIHRAHFSAITGEALRNAFQNLGEPDAALSRSVDARQELDLRVGVAMTRLLTWRCVGMARRKYSDATKLISYGPCQTPTLSFCVARARAVEAFQAQDFWKIQTSASFAGATAHDKLYDLRWKPPSDPVESTSKKLGFRRPHDESGKQYEDSSTFDKQAVDEVLKFASLPGSLLRVTQVTNESERVSAPPGLNTVTLLSAGSKSMGMSPKQVMNVAEKLYSSGFISYPRTETTKYDPTGFDVRQILRAHADHPDWGRTASHLLRTRFSSTGKPPARGTDVGDHPPITCLRSATRETVGGGSAWRVYEFVARNMLGSFSDDLYFKRSVAELELVARNEPEMTAQRKHYFEMETVKVDSLGFAGACPWLLQDIGAQKNEADKDVLVKGMCLVISKIRCDRKKTRPNPFLQEHELIELMDRHGVGTDASMATHVSNIVDRGYVVLCDETGVALRPPPRPGQARQPRQIGRYMVPTPLGMALMDLFGDKELSNEDASGIQTSSQHAVAMLARPAIRARMEAECKQIAEGKMDKDTCLQTNLQWFQTRYREMADVLTNDFLRISFARTLRPLKDGLQRWRQMRAFEVARPTELLMEKRGRDSRPLKKGGDQRLDRRKGSSSDRNQFQPNSERNNKFPPQKQRGDQRLDRRKGSSSDANNKVPQSKTNRPRLSKLISRD